MQNRNNKNSQHLQLSYKPMEIWSYNRNADTVLTIAMWTQQTVIAPIIKDLNWLRVSQNLFCNLVVTCFLTTVLKCSWLQKNILCGGFFLYLSLTFPMVQLDLLSVLAIISLLISQIVTASLWEHDSIIALINFSPPIPEPQVPWSLLA